MRNTQNSANIHKFNKYTIQLLLEQIEHLKINVNTIIGNKVKLPRNPLF